MPKKLSELLEDYLVLSDKQYYAARIAGYTQDDLYLKSHDWYAENRDTIISDKTSPNPPILAQQVEFLKANGYSESASKQLTYKMARHAIVKLIQEDGKDERFISIYEKEQAHNKGRNERRKTREVPQTPIVSQQVPSCPGVSQNDPPEPEPPWNHRGEELLREAMKHGRIVKQ